MLRFSLEEFPITQPPDYTALSYTWQEEQPQLLELIRDVTPLTLLKNFGHFASTKAQDWLSNLIQHQRNVHRVSSSPAPEDVSLRPNPAFPSHATTRRSFGSFSSLKRRLTRVMRSHVRRGVRSEEDTDSRLAICNGRALRINANLYSAL